MAVGEKCSVCQAESSPVWRKHKVTRERVCNRCYLKPPAADLGAFSAEEFASLVGEKEPKAEGANERGHRKRKHRSKDEAEGSASEPAPPADMDLSTPAVETDSEYADVSLDDTPKKIVVKASGHQKIDGTYQRLTTASRGKPCYAKFMEKKLMYLFWNKKWIIGWDFGSSKSYANVKDTGKSSPCEPYSKVWKVLDKHDKKDKHGTAADSEAKESRKYVDTLAMRVIDFAALEFDVPDFDLPDEHLARARHSRKETSRTKSHHKSAEGKEKAASENKAGASAEKKDDEDAVGPGSSSEEEKERSEASAEESDSSSEESSSSSSPSPKDKNAQAAAAPVEARKVQESPEKKSAEFEAKMREKLSKVPAGEHRQKQFNVVKDQLMKRANGVDGIAQGQLQAVLSKLQRWIHESAPPEPAASTAELRTAQPAAQAPRASAPARSALRKPGAPRQRARRIHFPDRFGQQHAVATQYQVESFRVCGEQLWYSMPGAVVVCDMCEKEVLQSMGSLQGAPSQSQFAQSKFLCTDCSGM